MLISLVLPAIVIVISDISILNTLEWTKNLDGIWIENKERDPELTWQYIGTQTGVLRSFPGQSSLFRHYFFSHINIKNLTV